jgi:phytoene dehydrogenase-like protein
MSRFDAIVIGGGISGLGVASLLSKRGYRTILLEKEPILGGRTSSFPFRGYTVDIGLHTIASYSSSGIGKLLEEVDAGLDLVPITPSLMHYDLDSRQYSRATAKERFGETLYKDFKDLAKSVSDMNSNEINQYHGVSAERWIIERFQNKELVEFFKKITGFAGQPMDRVSAGAFLETLHDAFASETTITYPAHDGIKALPDALESAIWRYGGEVVTDIRVNEIVHDDGAVKGVRAKIVRPSMIAELEFLAPRVVFTVPLAKLRQFLPKEKIGVELLEKISKLDAERYYYNGLIAGVARPLLDDFSGQFFQWTADRGGMDWHAIITIPTYVDPDLAPEGYHLLFADSHGPMPFGDKSLARARHRELVDLLVEIWPDFKSNVDWMQWAMYPDILPLAQIALTGPNRPGFTLSSLKGMYLAGDATYLTGSGIGSAVKSAYGCLKEIEQEDL